jgi:WD40 repeat protein
MPDQEINLPALAGPMQAGCQSPDDADPQAESLRLAGEAQTLLAAERPDTELARLLSICALQIGYTPEADTALQEASIRADTVSKFDVNMRYIWGLAFTSDGRTLYTAGADPAIRIWDVQTGEQLRNLLAKSGGVGAMTLSADERYLLVVGPRGIAISLQDIETGEVLRTFSDGLSGQLSLDGKYVLTSSTYSPVTLWDVSTGEELRTFDNPAYGSLSPDGRFVATIESCPSPPGCSPQTVRLYDTQSGELLRSFETDIVTSPFLRFSHDGRYLVTGQDTYQSLSTNNSTLEMPAIMQLWDVESGSEVRRLEGHHGFVGSVVFSADDKTILTASYDGTARLWVTDTGQQLRIFAAENGEATVASFSPDGRQVVIGYEDGPVMLWHTDYHDFIADACAKVTRDFSAEERAAYGISGDAPTCPQFGADYELPAGMTPVPVQPVPAWTPLPPLDTAKS